MDHLSWDDVDERLKRAAPIVARFPIEIIKHPSDVHPHDLDWCRWSLMVGSQEVETLYAHHLDAVGAFKMMTRL